MKQIIKTTDSGDQMVFEKYSRADLKGIIKDFVNIDTTQDFDMSISWTLFDGSTGYVGYGYPLQEKTPAINKIAQLYVDNSGSTVGFFGGNIVKNETYGDFEIEF